MAEEAREALGLERVLFVPAGRPWQKADRTVSAGPERMAMLRLAIAGNPAFEASTIELDREGPTYTVDTIEALVEGERGAGREPDLWFVLSGEALAGLPTWRDPERVLRSSRLAVVPRVGERATADGAWVASTYPELADRVRFLDGPRLEVSGTLIRARVAAGRSIRYLVPDAVAAYIGDHGLYRAADGGGPDDSARTVPT
jgi:nicotinate-nucleotide adenylyltransferase